MNKKDYVRKKETAMGLYILPYLLKESFEHFFETKLIFYYCFNIGCF